MSEPSMVLPAKAKPAKAKPAKAKPASGQAILGLLENITAYGYDMRTIFRDWVRMSEATLLDMPGHVAMVQAQGRMLRLDEQRPETQKLWAELEGRYKTKWPQCFSWFRDAFQMLLEVAERDGIQDILGPMHQDSGFGNAKLGQFFTPWSLSMIMAEMTITERDIHDRLKAALCHPDNLRGHTVLMIAKTLVGSEDAERFFVQTVIPAALPFYKPLVANDPCVGSGATLLALAASLPYWAIGYGLVRFTGQDIDELCVSMARVQFMLFGLRGPD